MARPSLAVEAATRRLQARLVLPDAAACGIRVTACATRARWDTFGSRGGPKSPTTNSSLSPNRTAARHKREDHVRPHSLGWVTARDGDGVLLGFVNVAWDGGDHAFLIDKKVRPDQQRRGIGTELVRIAARHAKEAGCEWMEADFDEGLVPFYYDACGFVPRHAGLPHLPRVDITHPS